MKIFRLNDKYSVVCEASNTRNGFKHTATLIRNGWQRMLHIKIFPKGAMQVDLWLDEFDQEKLKEILK